MFFLVATGFGELIERGAERCEAAATTIEEINGCDPGLNAMLGATAAGTPWLLLSVVGALFGVAAFTRWAWSDW